MSLKAILLGGKAKQVAANSDELTLCQRIAGGERHLFAEIIDRYSGLVAGAIASQGVPAGEVEDLAQQALINVYKGIHGFRGEAKLSSWIYRIAVNVARQAKKRAVLSIRPESVEEAREVGRIPADPRTAAADSVVKNQALSQALSQLSSPQRTALVLYYMEELSYEEIAEAMGLNIKHSAHTHPARQAEAYRYARCGGAGCITRQRQRSFAWPARCAANGYHCCRGRK